MELPTWESACSGAVWTDTRTRQDSLPEDIHPLCQLVEEFRAQVYPGVISEFWQFLIIERIVAADFIWLAPLLETAPWYPATWILSLQELSVDSAWGSQPLLTTPTYCTARIYLTEHLSMQYGYIFYESCAILSGCFGEPTCKWRVKIFYTFLKRTSYWPNIGNDYGAILVQYWYKFKNAYIMPPCVAYSHLVQYFFNQWNQMPSCFQHFRWSSDQPQCQHAIAQLWILGHLDQTAIVLFQDTAQNSLPERQNRPCEA